MRKTMLGLATAVLLAVPAISANAALNAYLKITGTATKTFTPDAPSGFQQVLVPDSLVRMLNNKNPDLSIYEARSGQATGRRTYEPIVFHKRIDKSSPLLAKAVADGERLPKVVLVLYRETAPGTVEMYAELTLTDCVLKQTDKATPKLYEKPARGKIASSASGEADDRPMESLSLNFSKIEWAHVQGKQSAKDYPQKLTYDIKKNTKG